MPFLFFSSSVPDFHLSPAEDTDNYNERVTENKNKKKVWLVAPDP